MRALILEKDLAPIGDVPAWGDARTGLELRWYGLTYGTYEMRVNNENIYGLKGRSDRVHFAVARFWGDLVELAPSALDPVPEILADRLNNIDEWHTWADRAFDLEGHDEAKDLALEWWYARQMEAYHLDAPPVVSMWRTGDHFRISWRPNRGAEDIWAVPRGDAELRTEVFLDELLAFDRSLMSAMDERVTRIENSWNRPDVHIDMVGLRRDHTSQCRALDAALNVPIQRKNSWTDIQNAISTIDRALRAT